MKGLKMFALSGFVASAALTSSSCVGVLGLDDEKRSAVEDYCRCGEVNSIAGGTPQSCVAEIGGKLERATEQTRAAWLEYYTKHCLECPKWAECFRLPPTCTEGGEPCRDTTACLDCCVQTSTGPTCAV